MSDMGQEAAEIYEQQDPVRLDRVRSRKAAETAHVKIAAMKALIASARPYETKP